MPKNASLLLVVGTSLAAALSGCTVQTTNTQPQNPSPVASTTEPAQPAPTSPAAESPPPPATKPPVPPPAPKHLNGKVVWYDLQTKQPELSKQFLTEIAGWSFEVQQMGEAKVEVAKVNGKTIASIQGLTDKKAKSFWVPYLSVPNVDAAVVNATNNKGSVVYPATDIPSVGRFAVIADPNGAKFALFTSAKGDAPDATPATGEFAWAENLIRNKKSLAAAVAFYPAVVGYTVTSQEMPGAKNKKDTYDLLMMGEAPRAGIDEARPAKMAGNWLPWIAVANVDTAATLIKKDLRKKGLRGKVLVKPFDVPMVGRMMVAEDPAGALIGFMTPLTPEEMKAQTDKYEAERAAKEAAIAAKAKAKADKEAAKAAAKAAKEAAKAEKKAAREAALAEKKAAREAKKAEKAAAKAEKAAAKADKKADKADKKAEKADKSAAKAVKVEAKADAKANANAKPNK